jgi:hypothetical protein
MSKRKFKRPKGDPLRYAVMKATAAEKFDAMSHNELADALRVTGDAFLSSPAWKALRRKVIKKHGTRCACCGHKPRNPQQVNVDHVKPRRFYPELALEESNLQVLCGACNKLKGNSDTDYRKPAWDGLLSHGEFSDYNIGKMLNQLR